MPFPNQTPRAFNRTNIEAITPNQYGCYGIMRGNTIVYVGKGDIKTRLLAHFNGDNACITLQGPTHWVDIVTSDMDNVEKRLIVEYQPACNQRVG